MGHKFPEVQGGGSLILAWQVKNKKVLVVGGGEVAAGRILNLLNADAKVTVISPREGLNPEVAYRIEQNQVEYVDRLFEPTDLDDPAITMVLTAVDDPEASSRIWRLCKEKRIAANIADVPPECDFYFGSVHRDGPLQIMVSTNGNGPKMANIVRRKIAASLPPNIGDAITKVGALRKKLRVIAPGEEQGPKRMQWMSKVCVKWSLEDLCEMDEEDMSALLNYYAPDQVPSLNEVRLGDEPGVPSFDGSFGWSCVIFSTPAANSSMQYITLPAASPPPTSTNMTPPTSTTPGGRPYYEGDVDFDKLAAHDAAFAAITKLGKQQRKIDFQNPDVLQHLTKALLAHDFNLTLTLPPDRLCPPVPVRWNYTHWIQHLLDTTSPTHPTDDYDPARQERIRLVESEPGGPLVALRAMGVEGLDFVMTNPPFYASEQDMATAYVNKAAPPSAVCTGSANEMICEGGEVGFVSRIIEESLQLRGKVQWYTAMIGRLPSLHQIVAKLKELKIMNFAVTSLQAGYRTNRWAIAWSFGEYRPRNDVARHGGLVLAVLPPPTAQTVVAPSMTARAAGERINETIRELDVRWRWTESVLTGVVEARENVWSRAARRKKKFVQARVGGDEREVGRDGEAEDSDVETVALAVKITCEDEKVDVRWLRGTDYLLFISFCGMLKTALAAAKQ
ncbi:siroheme synthase [Teratosphaeria destructans]|uniref:precorrin-2 dehydrogenase n=1 Tax=Teratosphaeria destructans TaxID=418781 RepID=A0A9W7SIZ1_9PEZI|nr:siroheme synthase [Teratosphaeria destructans]